ncbi:MAG: hypothetical protein QM723_01315 [Myxococcaceae bacterium]
MSSFRMANNKHPDLMKFRVGGDAQPPSGLPGVKGPAATPAPSAPPATPANPTAKDGFDAAKKAGPAKPPSVQDLRDSVKSDPNFKSLSPQGQQAALEGLSKMSDPKMIQHFKESLGNEWLQKLPADKQAATVRSLAHEHMDATDKALDKLRERRKEIIRNFEG